VRALAPAKVNPWLFVLGRRSDGYHEIDSGLLALELGDQLAARAVTRPRADDATGGVTLRLSGPALTPDVPAGGENLAVRAARAVLRVARAAGAVGPAVGLELELEKRVPSRAGLGGGSADAVAALLAARAALGLEVDWPGLVPLAAELGSDTVFFTAPTGFARCTGRGEQVEPLAPAPGHLAVAVLTPALEASTAAVYAAHDRRRAPPAGRAAVARDLFARPLAQVRGMLANELEPAAQDAVPGLAAWRELLDRNGAAHLRLCGSGSSFFGLFETRAEASACLERVVAAARERGLATRGTWVTRPAGRGVVRVDPSRTGDSQSAG
jgi:4-diphosphocytidyl-2-C-methyl-D-erythritol kinase